jgi:hypothetical protein
MAWDLFLIFASKGHNDVMAWDLFLIFASKGHIDVMAWDLFQIFFASEGHERSQWCDFFRA